MSEPGPIEMAKNKATPNYTFKLLAKEVLEGAASALTAEEIWEQGVDSGLHKRLKSGGKTPAATLYADLHRDTLREDSEFVRVGSRPRRYWLKSRGEQTELHESPKTVAAPSLPLSERELHPLLSWFADARMGGVLTKTIYHEKSTKKSFGEWVHPDMVGILFPRRALESVEALRLSSALSAPLCRLYSFELKLRLGFGNLREAFFQAVSNSSWANEAYLVCAEFDSSPEFQDELKRLCSAFGIGAIELSLEEPLSSSMVIPAKERELEWRTLDKLAEMNPDFATFVKSICDDLRTDIHVKEYDSIPGDPELYIETLKKAPKK